MSNIILKAINTLLTIHKINIKLAKTPKKKQDKIINSFKKLVKKN